MSTDLHHTDRGNRRVSTQKYHHGNLRAVILEDAIATVETAGPQSLSLRQLAKNAGVSSTATYSHFKTKRELLAALATVGFQRLYEALQVCHVEEDDPSQGLQRLMETMVCFAIENPGLYSLMFGQEISGYEDSVELWESMSSTYTALENSVRKTKSGRSAENAVQMATYACWSKAHGLALLMLNEKIGVEEGNTGARRELIRAILSFPV